MKKMCSGRRLIMMLLAAVLPVLMGGLFLPLTARAEDVTYIDRWWDEDAGEVKELQRTCLENTVVGNSTTAWSNGWYVVNSDVTIDSRITVTGTVNLILCDGKTLTAPKGITVQDDDNKLYIYGQDLGTGKLVAGSSDESILDRGAAGIGGYDGAAGTITINGGTVDATGIAVSSRAGAGIGGGSGCDGGIITINGGSVTAWGGDGDGFCCAAGIGGGDYASGGTIKIYGGYVEGVGGTRGAGIGGGNNAAGGTIEIYGGSVNATGGIYGAGIGGGDGGDGGNITIENGIVRADGNAKGAGIGGGYNGDGGTVTIMAVL